MNSIRIAACSVLLLLAPTSHAQDAAVDREKLRYDGKPFEYWRNYLQTELKPELRVEAIRALTSFGTNGYEAEATRAIVKVIVTPGLDQEVWSAGRDALGTIGTPATAVVLDEGTPNVFRALLDRYAATWLVVDETLFLKILDMTKSAHALEREMAFGIISWKIETDAFRKPFQTVLEKHGQEQFIARVIEWDPTGEDKGWWILHGLGRTSTLVPGLIAELEKLQKERASQDAQARKRFRPDEYGKSLDYLMDTYTSPLRSRSAALINKLGSIGPAAKAALDELAEATRDPSREVREAAEEAIRRITLRERDAMSLNIKGPMRRYKDRQADFTIKLANPGETPLTNARVRSRLPAELAFIVASDRGQFQNGEVVWNLGDLGAREERTVTLSARAQAITASAVQTVRATADGGIRQDAKAVIEVFGLPALQTRLVDQGDPVEVGKKVVYVFEATSTGDVPVEKIEVTANVPPQLILSSVKVRSPEGMVGNQTVGNQIRFGKVDLLPGHKLVYELELEAVQTGDARFGVQVSTPSFSAGPMFEEESTKIVAPVAPGG